MIERYTYPEMKAIWSEENKFSKWLQIELLAAEAWSLLGRVPEDSLRNIKAKARFDINRIAEIEEITNHDVIAFLTCVAENVGEDSRYIHLGMTSSDVVDTALAVMMKDAISIIIEDVKKAIEIIKSKAQAHKYTPMMGRTHGVHAEPITLGLKFAVWFSEMNRNLERLKQARDIISVGKISGAVGTYASVDPFVEEHVCKGLGLKPAPISTQILQRDRHAQYMTTLAIVASSLEKFATEIRNLQRTEILELQEGFRKGQKGSSAMPHKRNPITCERIVGLARVIRSNAIVAMENVALWHERDLTHSSTERVIIPDSTTLLDYILRKFISVMQNLVVREDRMRENIERTGGLIFSEKVLLALVDKGLTREDAYAIVQRNAMSVWEEGGTFREKLLGDEEFRKLMSPAELDKCFDYSHYFRHVDTIFERLGL